MNRHDVDRSALPSPDERILLRESVRRWLEANWPVAGAVERAGQAAAVAALWQGLADQGLVRLGADPGAGGLREVAVVMEELGRAACPVPLLGHLLGNLVLARASARGEPLVDPAVRRRLHTGPMRLTMAFAGGAAPGNGGDIECVDGRTSGLLRFVDHGLHATHLLIAALDALLVIDLREPGASVIASNVLGGNGWTEVRLEHARSDAFPLQAGTLADLRLLARLALVARAHGAARRAFELVVDDARERQRSGEALQHRLANGLIALEGVRFSVEHAAQAFDHGLPEWRYVASAAIAFGAHALRELSLQTQHAFGSSGCAEEHEAPRHFRQVQRDTTVLGGAPLARQELAAHLLDDDAATLPADDLGDAGDEFRASVREWLEHHWSGKRKAAFDRQPFPEREFDESFALDVGRTGWLGAAWPREFGGQARSPREQLALIDAMERADAPRVGPSLAATALMRHGTREQQQRYLPEILRGEAVHAIGCEEANGGCELGMLRTSAARVKDQRGDGWVIEGRDIRTATWWAKYLLLAARTDPGAKPPHAGISVFIVPLDSPGITVARSTTIDESGCASVRCERVWVSAGSVVGPVNGGWDVLTDALAQERGLVGGRVVLKVAHAFDLLCKDLRNQSALRRDPLVRDRIGQLAAEIEVARQLMLRCAERGAAQPELAAISQVFSVELMERFGSTALDLLGPRAALSRHAPGSLRNGRYEENLRQALTLAVGLGSQRALIAQRGLGLAG
jgi:alkylation response protein AidB-like acyl-CoA dehydrogenase